jgi:hypothetical protein
VADDFDAAFAQFASPGEAGDKKPDEAPADTPPADEAPADTPPADAPPADAPPADEPPADTPPADAPPADAPPADTPPADEPPADTPPADEPPAPGPDADAILAGLKKLVGDAKADPASPAATPPASEQPAVYTPEEQTRLAKYDEDWKEVAECEALKRRAEYQQLLAHVFTQVANYVKPIQETAEAVAQRTFIADVTGAVPDYSDKLRADVIAWVKTQPTYLQVAYNHVIEEGTVDEVKDLVGRFRQSTGKVPGAGAPTPSKGAAKGNELSDEAKQAAAALAPVDSKRSGVQQPSDPSNFDDAWKEAAAGLG